jgi:hypothetical protein
MIQSCGKGSLPLSLKKLLARKANRANWLTLHLGLISAGRIATGIVGIAGTAMSGPVGEPVTLSGFAEARDVFGLPDDFEQPEDGAHALTSARPDQTNGNL